jgi:hypothetical protein
MGQLTQFQLFKQADNGNEWAMWELQRRNITSLPARPNPKAVPEKVICPLCLGTVRKEDSTSGMPVTVQGRLVEWPVHATCGERYLPKKTRSNPGYGAAAQNLTSLWNDLKRVQSNIEVKVKLGGPVVDIPGGASELVEKNVLRVLKEHGFALWNFARSESWTRVYFDTPEVVADLQRKAKNNPLTGAHSDVRKKLQQDEDFSKRYGRGARMRRTYDHDVREWGGEEYEDGIWFPTLDLAQDFAAVVNTNAWGSSKGYVFRTHPVPPAEYRQGPGDGVNPGTKLTAYLRDYTPPGTDILPDDSRGACPTCSGVGFVKGAHPLDPAMVHCRSCFGSGHKLHDWTAPQAKSNPNYARRVSRAAGLASAKAIQQTFIDYQEAEEKRLKASGLRQYYVTFAEPPHWLLGKGYYLWATDSEDAKRIFLSRFPKDLLSDFPTPQSVKIVATLAPSQNYKISPAKAKSNPMPTPQRWDIKRKCSKCGDVINAGSKSRLFEKKLCYPCYTGIPKELYAPDMRNLKEQTIAKRNPQGMNMTMILGEEDSRNSLGGEWARWAEDREGIMRRNPRSPVGTKVTFGAKSAYHLDPADGIMYQGWFTLNGVTRYLKTYHLSKKDAVAEARSAAAYASRR